MNRSPWFFRLCFLCIVAFLMAAIWLLLRQLGMPASLAPAALSDWLAQQGMFGPLFLMLMMILAVVVGPIPTLPVSAAAGLGYGIFTGTAIAVTGALAGSLIAFYLARILGREAVQRKLDHNPVFSARGSQRFLFMTVLLTRLIPLFLLRPGELRRGGHGYPGLALCACNSGGDVADDVCFCRTRPEL